MGWQWHQLDHTHTFAPQSIWIITPVPHHSIFSGWMLFLPTNQQCQSTEGNVLKQQWRHKHHTTPHYNRLQPLFWDHPGEPVPEQNLWTLWCKRRLTEADTPTIWLGATPSGLTSVHLNHPPFLQAGCPSCRPTNSVKALKSTFSKSSEDINTPVQKLDANCCSDLSASRGDIALLTSVAMNCDSRLAYSVAECRSATSNLCRVSRASPGGTSTTFSFTSASDVSPPSSSSLTAPASSVSSSRCAAELSVSQPFSPGTNVTISQ